MYNKYYILYISITDAVESAGHNRFLWMPVTALAGKRFRHKRSQTGRKENHYGSLEA
jgi:hypothetical protein